MGLRQVPGTVGFRVEFGFGVFCVFFGVLFYGVFGLTLHIYIYKYNIPSPPRGRRNPPPQSHQTIRAWARAAVQLDRRAGDKPRRNGVSSGTWNGGVWVPISLGFI